MVEPSVIREMLEDLKFDEAERALEQGGEEPDPGLREEIEQQRAKAAERADALCHRVIELGEDRNLEEISLLADAPATRTLLDLAPDASRERAELYMREAARWAERHRETNSRRLTEARRALEGLDLELARGLVNKVDDRFLTEEQQEERDGLLLDISARTMEMESLSEAGDRLIEDSTPRPRRGRQRRPWWRRWFG